MIADSTNLYIDRAIESLLKIVRIGNEFSLKEDYKNAAKTYEVGTLVIDQMEKDVGDNAIFLSLSSLIIYNNLVASRKDYERLVNEYRERATRPRQNYLSKLILGEK